MIEKFSHGVTKYKKSIITVFVVLFAVCAVLMQLVSVNYDLVDYLPKEAQSTTAIQVMQEEFGGDTPNTRIMLQNVTIPEALEYKNKIAELEGVTSVTWLDDVLGLNTLTSTPVEFLDPAILKNYYKENCALISASIKGGMESGTVQSIYDLIGEENAADGEAVSTAVSQNMSMSEVMHAMAILLPVILIILILTTNSWVEPLLFLITIGVAVLINMGTNIFFGKISFITQAISPILQLAVSLDYAIFLLHSFNEFRHDYEPNHAMRLAVKKALSSVAASAATTVIGFLALVFMRFGIGPDLGLNLVKGVILSFISVMVFLPALTLVCYKIIDKTKHRPLIPSFQGAGKLLLKIRIPFLVLAAVIVVPCFLAQANTEFLYGMGEVTKSSRLGDDAKAIEARFGKDNLLVLLVEREDAGKEAALCEALSDIPHITGIVSYTSAVGAEIPPEYVPAENLKQFYSENYARIILYTDMPEEGDVAFSTVKSVLDTAKEYYKTPYLTGQSATLYDMRNVVSADTNLVNLIAVVGIFLVLLLTFKSLSIPLFLVFTIETAIWINLSIAYFSGLSFNFIGYLVISTVQLGATVDYAILLTDRYRLARQTFPAKEAMRTAISENLVAILTSATILATAGFTLGLTSSNPIIIELGILLGRGTVLSLVMVACVLPALLILFDKIILKTTLRSGFHAE